MNCRKDFELQNIFETVIDYAAFEVGLNSFCIMLFLQDYRCQGMEYDSSDVNSNYNLIRSSILGSVALFKRIQPCWKRYEM